MNYRTILWLNLASIAEAFLTKILIDYKLVVCNMTEGLISFYSIMAMITVKNMLVLAGYQMYFWPQKNHKSYRKRYLQPTKLDEAIPAIPELFWFYSPIYYLFFSL